MTGISNKVESERIINISAFEQLICEARAAMAYLKRTLEQGDKEASMHLAEQLDLKLHNMEAFEFIIERRTIIVNNHCEHQ